MNIPRSQKHFGFSFDDVASHSHQTSVIAYCLCRMEGLDNVQGQKAIAMAVFHDLAEARTGNKDFIEKNYVVTDEEKATKDQLGGLDFSYDLEQLIAEYEERKTLVARCVKDADSLQPMYTEWVLAWQGNRLAQMWFDSDFNDRVPGMFTESARKLALTMKDSHPHEWWWSEFMENNAAKNLEHLLGRTSKKNEGIAG